MSGDRERVETARIRVTRAEAELLLDLIDDGRAAHQLAGRYETLKALGDQVWNALDRIDQKGLAWA